jgi:Tol biopolymer transport system component
MTRRMLYLPVMIAAAMAVACAVALSAVSEKVEATFPGKNGRIAYSGFGGGTDGGIYTINSSGGGKFRVTSDDKGAFDSDYSPDGKRIAYAGYEGPDTEIYTISVDGGGKVKVTNNVKNEEVPSYSPDGEKIAYEGYKALGSSDDEDFDHEIYTIKIGGGGKTQVTDTAGYASDPSWGSRP